MSLSKMKLSEVKLDVIQKSIQKINYEISISKCEKAISKLSSCSY